MGSARIETEEMQIDKEVSVVNFFIVKSENKYNIHHYTFKKDLTDRLDGQERGDVIDSIESLLKNIPGFVGKVDVMKEPKQTTHYFIFYDKENCREVICPWSFPNSIFHKLSFSEQRTLLSTVVRFLGQMPHYLGQAFLSLDTVDSFTTKKVGDS